MDTSKDSANPAERATAAGRPDNGAQPQSSERPRTPGRRGAESSQTIRPRPSIRLQRFPSAQAVPTLSTVHDDDDDRPGQQLPANRRRSSSEPQRPVASGALGAEIVRTAPQTARMDPVTEEAGNQVSHLAQGQPPPESSANVKSRLRSASLSAKSMLNRSDQNPAEPALAEGEYGAGIVNLLDVVGESPTPSFSMAPIVFTDIGFRP